MSSDAAPPPLPRPSVFISYASEDRAAARALRDTLAASGLEVWYDENELGGGDAWDQKIRRQIRDCDYFLPMISAATEARKEGYFRREWRLAAERTLDMADDVLFLLPVAIDHTSEAGARVPDKFLTVQWLRLPGGQSTPALEALCRRLLAGEHTAPPRPAASPTRPPVARPTTPPPAAPAPTPLPPPLADSAHHVPPPMPPFPHPPEKGGVGHFLKFLAEAFWWMLTAGWLLFKRAPRWLRVLFTIWFVLLLFSRCGRETEIDTSEKKAARSHAKDVATAIKATTATGQADPDLTPAEIAKLGAELARGIAAGLDPKSATAPLAAIPFAHGVSDPTAAKFADAVFAATSAKLFVARPNAAAIPAELPATTTDAALVAFGKKFNFQFVLAARLTEATPRTFAVRLLRIDDGAIAWSATFPLDASTAPAVADQISTAVLAALPAAK